MTVDKNPSRRLGMIAIILVLVTVLTTINYLMGYYMGYRAANTDSGGVVVSSSPVLYLRDNNNRTISGAYFPGETMCVYLRGRTLDEINNTINHEYLHYLIDTQQGHFCPEVSAHG